jgi:TM2 domain-containing membrane protein YozV
MYYLLINGQRTGPYSAQDIQQMLRQGGIGYETHFWTDGMLSWESIGSQKHLFESSTYPTPQQYYPPQQFQQPLQYYQQPGMMQPVMMYPPKSRVAFILLGLFLGGLGVHNFYAGYVGKGIAQLLLNLFLFWTIVVPLGVTIWIIVEVCTVDQDSNGNRMM